MALLDRENLAGMKAKREKFRLNHVGTKLNESELAEFMALVERRKQTPSEFIRELISREILQDKEGLQPSPELIEIVSTRLLLLNTMEVLLASTKAMSSEKLKVLIDEIAKAKHQVAREKIKEARKKS